MLNFFIIFRFNQYFILELNNNQINLLDVNKIFLCFCCSSLKQFWSKISNNFSYVFCYLRLLFIIRNLQNVLKVKWMNLSITGYTRADHKKYIYSIRNLGQAYEISPYKSVLGYEYGPNLI